MFLPLKPSESTLHNLKFSPSECLLKQAINSKLKSSLYDGQNPPGEHTTRSSMARTRSIRIRESLEELEQLRRFYKGTPQERRILFLSFLKESSGRTIAEASVKAGISERRGRRWWDAYRKGGLSQLFELRIWKKEEMDDSPFDPHFSDSSPSKETSSNLHTAGIDFPAFLVSVASLTMISDPGKWARALGDALVQYLPEINYAVVSVRSTLDIDNSKRHFTFHQHVLPNGQITHEVQSMKERQRGSMFESLIEQGKQRGFPFDKYHYPPACFDFYVSAPQSHGGQNAIPIASLLLLRNINEPSFSQEILDLVERLRPFLTFLFTDFIVRNRQEKPGADLFNEAVDRVAEDVGLSPREQDVLLLEMLGHSYDEIADLLHVSPKTIQTHVRALYHKAGVSRLSEFFARYFTPRTQFAEKKTE